MSSEVEVLDAPRWPGNSVEARKNQGTALVPTPKKRYRLKNLRQVADELARVYRSMRHGEIDPADGSRYAYVLQTLGKVIEAAEFEKRIEALEAQQKGGE